MRLNFRILAAAKRAGNRSSGFTMVEIALSLAVVAFALVAIIGVLPTGMTVQKDNREDTIINQEGRYWIEAIKSGALGLDDITNYVENIRIEQTPPNKPLLNINNIPGPSLFTPTDIIALLSTPKFDGTLPNRATNRVTARVKAITGSATEKSPLSSTNLSPDTFRYQLQTEIVPYFPLPPDWVQRQADATTNQTTLRFNQAMGANLWDVRLILRWPVIERGNDWFIGSNRKTFRARIAGTPQVITNFSKFIDRQQLFVFGPDKYNVTAGFQEQP